MDREEDSLYTYKASLERVVDGDTLRVKIDLGFDTGTRQYLRLRGIDAPERDTSKGHEAYEFVKRELASSRDLIVETTRSGKYDRYLSDVFYISKPARTAS